MSRNLSEKLDGNIYSKKLIFIYGKSPVLGENLDGKFEIINKIEEDSKFTPHVEYFRNYVKENLAEDKNMPIIAKRKEINTMLFLMQRMGHIAFAESTSKNHSKFGILYLPKTITENQKKSLKELKENLLKEEYQLNVVHDLYLEPDGYISGKTDMGTPEMLNKFIKNNRKDNDINER